MDWMIHLSSLILFTTVTGSVLLGIWYAAGRKLEDIGGLHRLYWLLKVVILSFLLPIVYVGMYWVNEWDRIGGGELFFATPAIYRGCSVFLMVWLAGTAVFSVYYIAQGVFVRHYYKDCFSSSEDRQMMFETLCKEMGIRLGKVQLCESYKVGLPFLTGCFRPRLYLPAEASGEEKLTEYELKVILVHELTHYKKRDVLWQRIVLIAVCCQWFNLFVWWLRRIVREWSEYSCDFLACERVGGLAPYFSAITDIAERASNRVTGTASSLVRKKHELERRALYMKKCKKQTRKLLVRVLTLVLVTIGVVSIYATSSALANGYIALFNKTAVYIEEKAEPRAKIEYVEYTEAIDETEDVEIGEIRFPRSMESEGMFVWTLSADTIMKSEEFYVEEGTKIHMHAWVSPSNVNIRMGLQTPYGTYRYIVGSGSVEHDFQITQSGNYRVYIKNQGSVEASVTGMYNVVTE